MDRSNLRVVYVNRQIREDKHIFSHSDGDLREQIGSEWELDDLRQDVERLLETFGRGVLNQADPNQYPCTLTCAQTASSIVLDRRRLSRYPVRHRRLFRPGY